MNKASATYNRWIGFKTQPIQVESSRDEYDNHNHPT
jgi:hypothetical protein